MYTSLLQLTGPTPCFQHINAQQYTLETLIHTAQPGAIQQKMKMENGYVDGRLSTVCTYSMMPNKVAPSFLADGVQK